MTCQHTFAEYVHLFSFTFGPALSRHELITDKWWRKRLFHYRALVLTIGSPMGIDQLRMERNSRPCSLRRDVDDPLP